MYENEALVIFKEFISSDISMIFNADENKMLMLLITKLNLINSTEVQSKM